MATSAVMRAQPILPLEPLDAICQRLRAGVPRVHAAESVGVARRTMMKWLEYGRAASHCEVPACQDDHHGPGEAELSYVHFLHMVEQAEADAVVLAVGHLTRAMGRDWRAALAWLDRRHPADFKPHERVEISGPEGGPVEVENARDKLLKKLDAISERMREEKHGHDAPKDLVDEHDDGPRSIAMLSIPWGEPTEPI